MENLILPPKVLGEVTAFLQVGCDFLQFNTKHTKGATGVYLLWWGQDITQQVCLSPPVLPPIQHNVEINDNSNHKGIRTSVYHITSEEDQFKSYLCDSDYLFLQIRDVDDNPIGFSAVEKLYRVIDYGGFRDDVPIYDCTEKDKNKIPEVIGHMRIWMTYDVRNRTDFIQIKNDSEELHENMHLQDSYQNDENKSIAQPNAIISNKYATHQTKRQITRANRSSPVLIVSKKKTPLRNSNSVKKIRKSEGSKMQGVRHNDVTGTKDILQRIERKNYDMDRVLTKKNVTFSDQNINMSPEYDVLDHNAVNENNSTEVSNAYNDIQTENHAPYNNHKINTSDTNINELHRLIDRSNLRIIEGELASSKNWQERERLLINKAKFQPKNNQEYEFDALSKSNKNTGFGPSHTNTEQYNMENKETWYMCYSALPLRPCERGKAEFLLHILVLENLRMHLS